jgi:hypothetical protein
MKEEVRSTKLDDKMDTEKSENNITNVKERGQKYRYESG